VARRFAGLLLIATLAGVLVALADHDDGKARVRARARHSAPRANPDAVGFFGMGALTPKVKMVAVKDAKGEAVKPTHETAASGRYPIARPLFLCTAGEPVTCVKDFIDFCAGAGGQEVVEKQGFVRVARTRRLSRGACLRP